MSIKIDAEGFPLAVKTEYKPVFHKFLETEIAKELPDDLVRAMAFVSYMQKIDRSARFKFPDQVDLGANVKLIRLFLRRHSLVHGLKNVEYSGKLTTLQNTVINALLQPTYVGVLRFEDGKSFTVNKSVALLTTMLFTRKPKQFENPIDHKRTLASKTRWVRLMGNPALEMAVYRDKDKDGILIRYMIALDQIFFYGGNESGVRKLESNIKRQIMSRRVYE